MEVSLRISGRKVPAFLVLVLLTLCIAYQNMNLSRPPRLNTVIRSRRLMKFVTEPALSEDYTKPIIRPVLAETLPVYIIWYGDFSDTQKSIVLDFFNSFDTSAEEEQRSPFSGLPTSVGTWWRTARGSRVHLESELSDTSYSKGKNLSSADIQDLALQHSQESFRENPSALYLVLTSADVAVEGFCEKSCAARNHVSARSSTMLSTSTSTDGERVLQFAWVGNSATQCPEQCAWPLAAIPSDPERARAVLPPNGDVGMDGMVINIVSMLARVTSMTPFHEHVVAEGLVTNADPSLWPAASSISGLSKEEAACRGVFGDGAHPGFQGHLWKEKITGTSFNAVGANGRRFLLPALWDSAALKCRIPS